MSTQFLWESLGGVSEHYVADAMPPSWQAQASGTAPVAPKKGRGGGSLGGIFDSGWTAAILSAVVAIAIIVAIVLAGRGDPDHPVPPVGGTSEETDGKIPDETHGEGTSETAPTIPGLPAGSEILSTVTEIIDEYPVRISVFRTSAEAPDDPPFLRRGLYMEVLDSTSGAVTSYSVHKGYATLFLSESNPDAPVYKLLEIRCSPEDPSVLQAVCSTIGVVQLDSIPAAWKIESEDTQLLEVPLHEDGMHENEFSDWNRQFKRLLTRLGISSDTTSVPATADPNLALRLEAHDKPSTDVLTDYFHSFLTTAAAYNSILFHEPVRIPGPPTKIYITHIPQDSCIVPTAARQYTGDTYLRLTAYKTSMHDHRAWSSGIFAELIPSGSAENVTAHPEPGAPAPILPEDCAVEAFLDLDGFYTALSVTTGDTTEILFLSIAPLPGDAQGDRQFLFPSISTIKTEALAGRWRFEESMTTQIELCFDTLEGLAECPANYASYVRAVQKKLEGADKVSLLLTTDECLADYFATADRSSGDKRPLLNYWQNATPESYRDIFFGATEP